MDANPAPPPPRMPWRATLPAAAALILGRGALWALRDLARPLGVLVLAIAIAEALAPPRVTFSRGVATGVSAVVGRLVGAAR